MILKPQHPLSRLPGQWQLSGWRRNAFNIASDDSGSALEQDSVPECAGGEASKPSANQPERGWKDSGIIGTALRHSDR